MAKRKKAKKKARSKATARVVAEKTDSNEGGIVVLEASLGIQHAGELSERLVSAEQLDSPVTIDAREVESLDLSILQLLIAFVNSAAKNSKSVDWKCGDGAVRRIAEMADLERHLKINEVIEDEVVEDDGLCPVF